MTAAKIARTALAMLLVAGSTAAAQTANSAKAASNARAAKPTIVLVHGAFVDASSFQYGATIDSPAWKTIPSWYLVSRQDHALSPDLERFYAKRMGATTSEIDASHLAFISHPKVVARLIEQAATAAEK